MIDQKLGEVLTFKINNDTILAKSLKEKEYAPYYEIIKLNKDTLNLKPFDNSIYKLDSLVDFIPFIRKEKKQKTVACNFTSLILESKGCPKSCPEFIIEIDSSGYFKFDEVDTIEKSVPYHTKLSNDEMSFICYLVKRVNFKDVQRYSNSPDPVLIFEISQNNEKYKIQLNEIHKISNEMADLITYLKNTPSLYKM